MQEFLSISLIIILAAISPGPDFAVVTKNSLLYSRKVGIYTALGVSISLLIHAIYSILGLALIISQSLLAFNFIKYLGAGYLIYIGIKSLLARKKIMELAKKKPTELLSPLSAFYQGLFCNLLNPKAIMFLLAFFTLIVKPGYSLWIEIGYGIEIAIIHMIWFSGLSLIITQQTMKENLDRLQFYIIKAMGVVLVLFGIRIAMLSPIATLSKEILN